MLADRARRLQQVITIYYSFHQRMLEDRIERLQQIINLSLLFTRGCWLIGPGLSIRSITFTLPFARECWRTGPEASSRPLTFIKLSPTFSTVDYQPLILFLCHAYKVVHPVIYCRICTKLEVTAL
jgi:hypothetical protein